MENLTSNQKRESVKKNYNLIAKEYSEEFGTYIEDLDIYHEFEKHLIPNAKILDLGAGSGRTFGYFNEKGYEYIGLDFSNEMKKYAYKIHDKFPYIVEDMIYIKKYFSNNSIDAIFAVYSLFHLPSEDLKKLLQDIYDILKVNGIFLFSYQVGNGEEMVDEPYLKENGKNVLYMNYNNNEEIKELLNLYSFKELFRKEKIENLDNAINSNSVNTTYILVQKTK